MPRLFSILRAVRWIFGPVVALCLIGTGSTAPGQAAPSKLSERRGITRPPTPAAATPDKPAPSAEPKPASEATAPSFFGDTSKFSRISGWGSFGNAMGQFGFAKSTLITMPPVQEELKLTAEQKEKLRLWQESMRKRGEEIGRSMRERGGNDPFRGSENLPIAARVMQFTSLINQFSGMARENETGLTKILNAPQRKRLNQISLQMEGITALTRPEIAEAVGLLPEEVDEIQQFINQSRVQQMTTWIGSMMAMRPNRQAPTDPNANPDRPRDPNAPPPARDEARPPRNAGPSDTATAKADPDTKARAEREQAMRKRFESMRDRTDQIQDSTVRQIARTLSKAQRTKFENMLGPPFDPKKINTFGRPPGRPGSPPAPDAKPAEGEATRK